MKKIERFIVYGLLAALFIAGILLDLKITEKLYNPGNGFGQAFEILADVPIFLLACFSMGLFIRFPLYNDKRLFVLCRMLGIVGIIGVGFYGGKHMTEQILRVSKLALADSKWLLIALIAASYIVIAYPLTFLVRKEFAKEAFIFAVFVVAAFAASVALMQGLKMIWLRPRYRTLVALYGVEEASSFWLPVYKITFFTKFDSLYGEAALGKERIASAMKILGIDEWGKEEFYSFPSGHTLNTTMTMMFFLASSFLPWMNGKELYVRISAYALGAIVGASRIVRGAHNLTDVTFGFLLAILIVDLLSTLLLPRAARFFKPKMKMEVAPAKQE